MIIGKLLGAVFGYMGGGFIGAIIGFIVGHFFDKGLASARTFVAPQQDAAAQQAFFTTVFTVMGQLAKADGRISEVEIARAEQMMTGLGLSDEHRREAIALFKRGATPEFQLEQQLAEFLQHCARHNQLKNLLLEYLLGIAMADGTLHMAEQELLQRVANDLGFSPIQFQQLLEMLRARQRFHQGAQQQREPDSDALGDAYRALGVSPTATDSEVKMAFRRLMSQHHPDKLMAQGVPEDMIKMATEKTQDIRAAYELIERARKG
jgi:DnaJ like chaperone protein